ncbi:MAG: aldo/keto reductase [Ilumatobacteraceae bacterium]
MEYALIGNTGLRVSRLAIGTAVFGIAPPEDGCDALVGAALDAGINLFDCANTYGNRAAFDRPGSPASVERAHAEELLGRALKGRRDDVVLCTKVSEPVGAGPNDGGISIAGLGDKGGGLSRYHIMREVERSLRRLGTDHIDVYYFHHPDPETAIEESLRAADDLVRHGKIRYVGLSTYAGWEMTEAVMTAERHGLSRPIVNQVVYNLTNRWPEREVVPAANHLGLGLTCFSPLAGGVLAGGAAIDRAHGGMRRWGLSYDYTDEQRHVASELGELATEWGHAPTGLALAWLLSRRPVAAAIVGPETPAELGESLVALDLHLDADQLDRLDAIGRRPFDPPV